MILKINLSNFTEKQWIAYFDFIKQQKTINPFAHVISALEIEAFKNKTSQRILQSQGRFQIWLFWQNSKCIASLEIFLPLAECDLTMVHAYFLSNFSNISENIQLKNHFQEILVHHRIKKLRITTSDASSKKWPIYAGGKLVIHDIIQELNKKTA